MNWYQTQDATKSVRQVVLEIPPGLEAKSTFGMLFFGAKYLHLMTTPWTAGFFRLDGDPGPYILVRGDKAVTKFRGSPVRVAFSFYRMKAGGLCAIFVDVDCPEVRAKLNYPHVLFEMMYGLDTAEAKCLIQDAFSRDKLHLCFAEGDGPGEMSGGIYSGSAINAQYDIVIPLPVDCRAALKQEWENLLAYHASIPANRRDFQRSGQQMQLENPQTENPIVSRSVNKTPLPASPAADDCHDAAKTGNVSDVTQLLANGINIDATDGEGLTALSWAVARGHVAVVESLLAAGANKEHRSAFGFTPLIAAANLGHVDITRLLVEAGADQGAKDDMGGTARSHALRKGHMAVVAMLQAQTDPPGEASDKNKWWQVWK